MEALEFVTIAVAVVVLTVRMTLGVARAARASVTTTSA
jgi:hypothetical protein